MCFAIGSSNSTLNLLAWKYLSVVNHETISVFNTHITLILFGRCTLKFPSDELLSTPSNLANYILSNAARNLHSENWLTDDEENFDENERSILLFSVVITGVNGIQSC